MIERVWLYGWWFNPPTLWHKELIQKLSASWKVDRIIFSPDWKRNDKNYSTTLDQRMRMLKAFYEAIKSEWLNVYFEEYFASNNINTSTLEVESFYVQKLWFQPWHIFWSDTISSIPNWVWNTHRQIEDHLKKIFIVRKWYEVPASINMSNYIVLDLDILEISSTTVREMISKKMSVDKVLTPEIKDIVLNESLYI